MVGIYKITSPSGKVYIGQSRNVCKRFRAYESGKGKKQKYLNASFGKHRVQYHVFEIIHELPADVDSNILSSYEILYIGAYKVAGFAMLNIAEGGIGGRMPEEVLKVMREKRRARIMTPEFGAAISRGLKGKKRSDAHSKAMSEARKGKPQSAESNIKRSEKLKGRISPLKGRAMTEEQKEVRRKASSGKRHSEETKQKIREANLGRRLSVESRNKISDAQIGRKATPETRIKMSENSKWRKTA